MKTMLKKVISMLIAVCLMVGVANIPVYAAVSATAPIKTTETVLSKPYSTPAQLAKQVSATTVVNAAKTTSTKTTKSKATTTSLNTTIINKYGKTGLTVLKQLASKVNLALQTVYNSFVKMGVNGDQMNKVSSTLINLMNKGETFKNCAALAVAKYLNISHSLAAVQDLAADISIDVERFVKSNSKVFTGTYGDAELKVLVKNGCKNMGDYECKLKDFTSRLKVGQKAIVHVTCYGGGGHAITVVREKNGFAVYDINKNNGNKVVYTKAQFEKLMKGSSYYYATSNGEMSIIADTTKIISSYVSNLYNKSISIIKKFLQNKTVKKWLSKEKTLITKIINNNKTNGTKEQLLEKEFSILNSYNKSISLISTLLKKKGISNTVKKWLNNAKILIDKTIGSNKSNSVKQKWLDKVNSALKTISNQKVSMLSLVKQTVSGVFSSLKNILKNNLTYKIYTKYGNNGINLISEFAKKYNLKQETIYNKFEKEGITKNQISETVNILNSIKGIQDSLVENKSKNLMRIEMCKTMEDYNSSFKNSKIGNVIKKLTGKDIEDVIYNEKIKNDNTYKMYKSYGYEGSNLIADFSRKYNLSQETIYNQFVKKGVTKEQTAEVNNILQKIETEESFIKNRLKQSSNVSMAVIRSYNKLKENNSLFQKTNIANIIKELAGNAMKSEVYNEKIENSAEYKTYIKYGEKGVNLIEKISNYLGLSKEIIYNQFINNGVSKEEINSIYYDITDEIEKGSNLFDCKWAYESINKTFAELKNLIK